MIYKALTKVTEMHDGVKPGCTKYDCPHHLVKVDVVVEGQYAGQPQASQECDCVPQDEE